MKLESLKLEKFKDKLLNKEEMLVLGATGPNENEVTGAGSTITEHSDLGPTHINYGYDVIRWRNGGITTYHNRTLVHPNDGPCQYT